MPKGPFVRTLRAQWLGQQLRQLRDECGMPLRLVAQHLRRDMSALARYERAEWPISRADVVALLDLYGFHQATERVRLLALAEEVWRTDRWDEDYGDVVDASFIEYPWLEGRAAEIKFYNPLFIPGLLQTRSYATAMIKAIEVPSTSAATIRRYVQLRLDRQEILDRGKAPRISVVLEDAAVRRQVGDVEVMRGQLERLMDLARRPAIDIRMLDSPPAVHAAVYGAFVLFTMPDPYPAVAYVENLAGQLYVEEPKALKFVRAYDSLLGVALDGRASAARLAAIAQELS